MTRKPIKITLVDLKCIVLNIKVMLSKIHICIRYKRDIYRDYDILFLIITISKIMTFLFVERGGKGWNN